jgi:hypothetical protein
MSEWHRCGGLKAQGDKMNGPLEGTTLKSSVTDLTPDIGAHVIEALAPADSSCFVKRRSIDQKSRSIVE